VPELGKLLAFGAYVPRLRLSRAAIADAIGWANPQAASQNGSRSFCNWDEDALTLAVEAGRSCVAGTAPPHLASLCVASTTLPFADRDNAALVAEALALPEHVETLSFGGSLRAGTAALLNAAQRTNGTSLVIATDARAAKPGSPQELNWGHAAAAFLVAQSSPDALATLVASHHLTSDFVDHYRLASERFDYTLEERWFRDEGLSKLVPRAIEAALAAASVRADDMQHVVMPGPEAGVRRVMKLAGLAHAHLQSNLHACCGDAGTAQPLLMLAAALETAQPGENVLLVGIGQGVDAVVIRAEEGLRSLSRRPVSETLDDAIEEKNYVRYLSHAGLVDVDFGMRAERDNRTAHTTAFRRRREISGFVGGRCRACETVQFPKSRVCVNPECRQTDMQESYPLSASTGRVKSFTEDWQAYSARPPYVYGNIEFAAGGNLLMEITDTEAGQVRVGEPVRFVFRLKNIDQRRGFRRYFWKAART
jgi:hydroxymethylglutaryl-CoA synthase